VSWPQNEDSNVLKHDAPGIISVKKGGGEFEFTIAPGPNPDLDKENIVIGKVIEGMGTVAALNAAPVSQGQFLEGAFKFSANVIGDVRAKTTFVNKPLQKIQVIKCGVLN
jgi:cyclophilin family peptidyl-prolyl cis-trans isomerase